MMKQLISNDDVKSSSDVSKYLQLENKCCKLLRNDEIRFIGIIDPIGNLISGGISAGIDLLETDEKRRQFYMQISLEIHMQKDFDDTLGKINYSTANRENILIITMPMNDHIILISALPTSSVEHIISELNNLGFFQQGI
ncbi:DUF6659 family protein [Nitrosopumilus sp.]|uniref:DUF6659 family protein n=1 Tax=Nitrosopumilus sp. TaxID=2024843 RepID=UPI0034A02ED3